MTPETTHITERPSLSRRQWLVSSGLAVGSAAAVPCTSMVPSADAGESQRGAFRYCFNTATILGQKLSLVEEVEIVAKAGYDGIEPWTRKLLEFVEGGGDLKDVGKRIRDLGLTVESAIGFPSWVVNDEARRAKGFEDMKRDMDMLRQIGGTRVAAPPAGANREGGVELAAAAERYGKLLELGDEMGVLPQLEIWGSSKFLSRLGEALYVAAECGHPKACVLPDVFHMYKSGSGFFGLGLLSGHAVHVIHMNDYPADPPRDVIRDSDRVYPGDGIAPMTEILRTLSQNGFQGTFSLELFNRKYWEQDPLTVARTGLEKMKQVVAAALS